MTEPFKETNEKFQPTEAPEAGLDPYGALFPLGIAIGCLGVLLWVAFQASMMSYFPRQTHGNLMFFGFLWSFISGFLMTAIPKMTQTQEPHPLEIFGALFLILLQLVFNLRNMNSWSVGVFGFQVLGLIIFVGRRFVVRQQIPFEGFIYLPIAMAWGLAGPICYFMFPQMSQNTVHLMSGQALVLNLIGGLGSRLIPVLSRVPSALSPDAAGLKKRFLEMGVWAAFLNLTFLIELAGMNSWAYALRAVFLLSVAVRYFKVLAKPVSWTYLGLGIKVSLLSLISGYVALAASSEGPRLALLHIVYIGGLTLTTLMVATRVTLAHGGYSLNWELKSPVLPVLIGLLFLAMILRLMVGSDLTSPFLSWAVVLFGAGLLLWQSAWWLRSKERNK